MGRRPFGQWAIDASSVAIAMAIGPLTTSTRRTPCSVRRPYSGSWQMDGVPTVAQRHARGFHHRTVLVALHEARTGQLNESNCTREQISEIGLLQWEGTSERPSIFPTEWQDTPWPKISRIQNTTSQMAVRVGKSWDHPGEGCAGLS